MVATLTLGHGRTGLAACLFVGLGLTALAEGSNLAQPQATTRAAVTQPVDLKGPPRILATTPKVGSTDVDPALSEITVTFDRDMAKGFSWTGGGPEFPPAPAGAKARWKDARTCVLPVTLKAASYYRVGINSKSHRNFSSTASVPALPSAIYFTTRGASDALKQKVLKPRIVSLSPKNGAQDVDPALTELRVSFSVPMGPGFSWTGGGPEFPKIPTGQKPRWIADGKTCVLPVTLQPGHRYRLGLNSPSHNNFQSAGGVPLDPVVYSFRTTTR